MIQSQKVNVDVGVIDCGIANITSLLNALDGVAESVSRISNVADFGGRRCLILPGVGAFPEAVRRLRERGLDRAITDHVHNHNGCLLGICLGMQLMMSLGTEFGETNGLSLIEGVARRLGDSHDARIPHIGWNSVMLVKEHPVFERIPSGIDFYFAHSFVVDCENETEIVARTDHGELFTSAIAVNNVVGVQFHPEKSSRAGIQLLRNFCEFSRC